MAVEQKYLHALVLVQNIIPMSSAFSAATLHAQTRYNIYRDRHTITFMHLACKLNVDCDLLVTSRREVKSRVWQCFERAIDGYL